MKIVRSILGIFAGIVIGTIVISAGTMIVTLIYPPPGTIDPTNIADLKVFYATRPTGAYIGTLIAQLIGVFFAAFAAAKIAGHTEALHGFIMILLYVVFGILKFSMFPEPAWTMVAAVVIYFIAGLAGSSFAGSLRKAKQN